MGRTHLPPQGDAIVKQALTVLLYSVTGSVSILEIFLLYNMQGWTMPKALNVALVIMLFCLLMSSFLTIDWMAKERNSGR